MKYFIGIVPPDNIYQAVVDIQNQFGDNRLEPHITLRPPVTVNNPDAWLNAIAQVCSQFSPIHIALPKTGNFGKRVLYIDVASPEFTTLHLAAVDALKPFEQPEAQQPERQSFNPHLTLGRSWCGFTKNDFEAMKVLAAEYLSVQPVSFDANFVRVYHKPDNNGRYQVLKDVQLSRVKKL